MICGPGWMPWMVSAPIDVYAELLAESRHVEGTRTERFGKKPRPVPINLLQR
jgi:hypothetical protein